MSIFENIQYWNHLFIPVIPIENYHYIFINEIIEIFDPIELTLSDSIYLSDKTRLLKCTIDEIESYELYVPIELLNKYIEIKRT